MMKLAVGSASAVSELEAVHLVINVLLEGIFMMLRDFVIFGPLSSQHEGKEFEYPNITTQFPGLLLRFSLAG